MKNPNSRIYTCYPFLFAFYPVLALFVLNIDRINLSSFTRLAIFSVLLSLLFWLAFSLFLKNRWKAGLLTLVFQVMFYSFGHEQNLLLKIPLISPNISSDTFLGIADLLLLAIFTFWIIRTKISLVGVSTFLTITCIILVGMPLAQIGYHYLAYQNPIVIMGAEENSPRLQGTVPDIYFIILDSYSREDLYKAVFNYDNKPFVDQLKGLGFQVMMCSRSNYNATSLTLSSMLNLTYDDTLGIDARVVSSGQDPMIPFIRNNLVHHYLQELGYNFYTFENEYPGLDWPGTVKFTMPKQETWFTDQLLPTENLFIKDTAVKILLDSQIGVFKQLQNTINNPFANHIKLTQFTFKMLSESASMPVPKFVYAHILLPHRPFVLDAEGNIRTDTRFFDKNGNPINDDFYHQGYIAQTEYINSKMVPILTGILKNSSTPPIIILMGDHGYAWKDTNFENLIAIYLPGNKPSPLYSTITNVNVFRSIFNEYFGGNYKMLPDISYRIDFKKGVYLKVPEAQPDCVKPVNK